MKILNLYAGIGGNRRLWTGHDITAVEMDEDIANEYKRYFPDDTVIVGDAHKYLEEHYSEFDFIWSSPPCPTHGQYRYNVGLGYKAVMPQMELYAEIIFLKHYFAGKWIVENTRPYYEPLVKPSIILQRHYIWCNCEIDQKAFDAKMIRSKNKISDYENTGFDISSSKIKNKRQVLRNAVDSELGMYILEMCSVVE